jgi:hypothetical protein
MHISFSSVQVGSSLSFASLYFLSTAVHMCR